MAVTSDGKKPFNPAPWVEAPYVDVVRSKPSDGSPMTYEHLKKFLKNDLEIALAAPLETSTIERLLSEGFRIKCRLCEGSPAADGDFEADFACYCEIGKPHDPHWIYNFSKKKKQNTVELLEV